jgi:hypothetical protein
MREKALAAVQARVDWAVVTGDPESLLDPDALVEADALVARVLGPLVEPGSPPDIEALEAVAELHWLRSGVLSGDDEAAAL